jgi:hypothetical protein
LYSPSFINIIIETLKKKYCAINRGDVLKKTEAELARPNFFINKRREISEDSGGAPIQPGWMPWRGFIGPTFRRIGTIGSNGDLRPKFFMRQNPVCLKAGPYEGSEGDSARLGMERKKN